MYAILMQFGEMASIRNDYFLCRQTPMHDIAKAIDSFPLTVREKYALCMCPVSTKNGRSMEVLTRFAAKFSAGEVSGLPNRTVPRMPKTFEDLAQLCAIFSELDLFLWLQNKFPPGNYIEQQNALALKETATRIIGEALQQTHKLRLQHCYVSRDNKVRKEWNRLQQAKQEMENNKDTKNDDDDGEEDADWNRVIEDL